MTRDEMLARLNTIMQECRILRGALKGEDERGGPSGGDPRYKDYAEVRAENEAAQAERDREAGRE